MFKEATSCIHYAMALYVFVRNILFSIEIISLRYLLRLNPMKFKIEKKYTKTEKKTISLLKSEAVCFTIQTNQLIQDWTYSYAVS